MCGIAGILSPSMARDDLDAALADPAIVHYAGDDKPWLERSSVRFRQLWWEVLAETPWAGKYAGERTSRRAEVIRRARWAAAILVRGTNSPL